ncbi:MAG: translation initiation factor IF-3 [Candidatus Omnitrophota bacterium]
MSAERPKFFRGRGRWQDQTRVNQRIRVPKVRLVDEEGNQLGVVSTSEALEKARDRGYDLVEVAPNTDPPVCRIMDYSKYKYEQEKKRKLAKKKQHVVHVKEIRFKARIEEHDYQVKLKHIKEFLERKDKVRVSLRLRGREMAHKELGRELMNRIANDVSALGEMDSPPKMMGRTISMTINPKA